MRPQLTFEILSPVFLFLMIAKPLAVIAGDDDGGVVVPASLAKRRQKPADDLI